MKTVCSFCNTIINAGTAADDLVSHGVCPGCYDQILSEFGFNVRKFLDILDAPVFLVDSDVNILAANTPALELVGGTIAEIRGKLCGDVLKCINASRPRGCGRTEYCPDCKFRASVNETWTTGKPVTSRSAILVRKSGDDVREIPFLVSTWKDGNAVLIRLRPVQASEDRE
jgi:PAS domain-containing protein